jgi:FecR protein
MAAENIQPLQTGDERVVDDCAQLESLLERLCDQLASESELAELNTLLTDDPAARAYYLRYIALHSSMHNGAATLLNYSAQSGCDCGSDATMIEVMRAGNRGSSASTSRALKLAWGLATAVSLAAIFWGGSRFWHGRPAGRLASSTNTGDVAGGTRDLTPVARVTQLSENIAWQNPNESIALLSHVHAGQVLQLSQGEIRLAYENGVKLRLLAPAEFVVDATGGRLLRGGLRAIVPKTGRGFTIETPNGKVVDLGTEFGVAVDDFGVSEVSVFQGIVDMFPVLGGVDAKTIRLTKGEAIQWNSATLVRLKADPLRFEDGGLKPLVGDGGDDSRPVLDEDLRLHGLESTEWRTLGDVKVANGTLNLRGSGVAAEVPCLITARQFAPTDGPITVVCDIRFLDVGRHFSPSFALLTRSADERDADAPESWRTMHTCVRCSFKSPDGSATGVVEAATKLDRHCPLTNILWRGFDRLEKNEPYRLVMTDDGINVAFTVSLRDDPSIHKTVTCRSLFRGKENYIAFEGPVDGNVAVDRIQVYQKTAAKLTASIGANNSPAQSSDRADEESIARQLGALAPADSRLIVQDDFDADSLDANLWTTLDEVDVIGGRVRLGKPNAEEHINTWTARPYLLTRQSYAPAEGTLTILGTAEFDSNFLNEYGGSFAVMTRADNRSGNGPGWEYSILRFGVRSNFWPAAWGQDHSLEIHEKPSPSTLSLLVAQGLAINPDAREYLFKVVDSGERVTLTIQDTHNPAIGKTVSVPTNPALRSGFIGFEGCWGCPVWLDHVRIYRGEHEQQQ